MSAAALASLRLLAEDTAAPRRRVVLAADVTDSDVTARADLDAPAEVTLAAAVGALPAADAGDPDAEFLVDGAEGHELLWYATQELADLVAADAPDR